VLKNPSMLRRETTAMDLTSLPANHSLNARKDSCAFHMEKLESQVQISIVLKKPSTLTKEKLAMVLTRLQKSHFLNARKVSCAFQEMDSQSQVLEDTVWIFKNFFVLFILSMLT